MQLIGSPFPCKDKTFHCHRCHCHCHGHCAVDCHHYFHGLRLHQACRCVSLIHSASGSLSLSSSLSSESSQSWTKLSPLWSSGLPRCVFRSQWENTVGVYHCHFHQHHHRHQHDFHHGHQACWRVPTIHCESGWWGRQICSCNTRYQGWSGAYDDHDAGDD